MKTLVATLTRRFRSNEMVTFAVGLVYFWFGILKFFPGLSPAENLAKDTLNHLTFGYLPNETALLALAILETGIGVLLIAGLLRPWVIRIAIAHIVLTFTPMLFFPELVFSEAPFGLTLLGQYIIKNVVIFCVLLFLLDQKSQN